MADEDPKHIAMIRKNPCCVCLSPAPSHPHHHTMGLSDPCPCGERHAAKVAQPRGKGARAHDHDAMPLCWKHHRQLHDLTGHFAGWTKAELRAWQDARAREFRLVAFDPDLF